MQNAPETLAILFIWFIFFYLPTKHLFFSTYHCCFLAAANVTAEEVKTLRILKTNVGKVGSVV